jgi:hypothetical protein
MNKEVNTPHGVSFEAMSFVVIQVKVIPILNIM